MLGRVNALGDSLAWAGIPLGGLIGRCGGGRRRRSRRCCSPGGAAYFLTTNLAGLRPEWRAMDRPGGRYGGRPHAEVDAAPPTAAEAGT